MGAVPIFHRRNRAYSMLAGEGWPFVGVSSWDEVTPQAMRGWWRAFAANLTCAKACMRLETMYGVLLRGATMAECCRELEAPPVGSAAGWKRA